MSIAWIRKTYNVPAKVGGNLVYTDTDGRKWTCRITGTNGSGHLRAKTETGTRSFILHPTWNVEYL